MEKPQWKQLNRTDILQHLIGGYITPWRRINFCFQQLVLHINCNCITIALIVLQYPSIISTAYTLKEESLRLLPEQLVNSSHSQKTKTNRARLHLQVDSNFHLTRTDQMNFKYQENKTCRQKVLLLKSNLTGINYQGNDPGISESAVSVGVADCTVGTVWCRAAWVLLS